MEGLTELQLQIPDRMEQRLTADGGKWSNAVFTVFQRAKNHFCNDPVFFPYYTFHGVSHINVVLKFADKLIPDATMEALDGKTIFVLISGIILHDLGMHLRAPGVKRFLFGDWRSKKADQIKDKTFGSAWREYLDEIRRFSEEKMLYHFGMTIVADSPNLDGRTISENDRLLVGEFLRRYHHSLAQEIQKNGFPTGAAQEHLIFNVKEDVFSTMANEWRLAGILAMSHGMSIRDAEKTVYSSFGNRNDTPCNVPIFYLMAVLRMADYLDAGEHRVPVVYSEEEKVPVPISASEWNWNELINANSFTWEENKENLRIQADPKGSIDFIQLEKWLLQIQHELDLCWAAIAEYYGTGRWDLSIHRIICNIQDPDVRKGYEADFLTKEARLTANPEIIKLMIAPLYGDDPSYGVRELIQNAVDACNERKDSEKGDYRGIIEIRLDTKAKTLTIADNGKGMNEDVLLNYYLSAGASYRFSDDWIREHTQNQKANFARNGRFGVGVLATFLLGNQITVTTRHVGDDLGYRFSFGIQPAQLEVKRISREPGTTIQVTLSQYALGELVRQVHYRDFLSSRILWFMWYGFEEPVVRYWMDGTEIKGTKRIPQDESVLPGWYTLPNTKYEMVRWSASEEGFFCNGIRIPESGLLRYSKDHLALPKPGVSVIDRNGELALNLSRRRLLRFDDDHRIREQMCRFAVARLLTEDWSSGPAAADHMLRGSPFFSVGFHDKNAPYLCSDRGYRLVHDAFAGAQVSESVLLLGVPNAVEPASLLDAVRRMNIQVPFFLIRSQRGNENIYMDIADWMANQLNTLGFSRTPKTECIWITSKQFEQFRNTVSTQTLGRVCATTIRDGVGRFDFEPLPDAAPFAEDGWDHKVIPVIMALNVSWAPDDYDPIRRLWKRYLGTESWIPYDLEERKERFPEAFKDLQYYMDDCPSGVVPQLVEEPRPVASEMEAVMKMEDGVNQPGILAKFWKWLTRRE